MGIDLAPGEQIIRAHGLSVAGVSWEVGRLVLATQYRSGSRVLKRCLFLTLLHLVCTEKIDSLFATCSPLLSRLYRRFGFKIAVADAWNNAGELYSLIYGEVPDVLMALAGSDAEKQFAVDALDRRGRTAREESYECMAGAV